MDQVPSQFVAFTLVLVPTDTRPGTEAQIVSSATQGDLYGCQPNFLLSRISFLTHGRSQPSVAFELKGRIGPNGSSVGQNMLSLMNRLAIVLRVRCHLQDMGGVDVESIQKQHDDRKTDRSDPGLKGTGVLRVGAQLLCDGIGVTLSSARAEGQPSAEATAAQLPTV